MHLSKDLREFIELLNSNAVEYVVVGAFAVGWHGWARFTADIDLLVRPQPENACLVVQTLEAFGFKSLGGLPEDMCQPERVIQLGAAPNRIDLITSISGVGFEEIWAHRVTGSIDGIPVFFIGLTERLRNKRSSGRPKDLADLDALERRRSGP